MRRNWNRQNPATDFHAHTRPDWSTGRRKNIDVDPWALSSILYGAPELPDGGWKLEGEERERHEKECERVALERENYRMKIFKDGTSKWRLVCPVDVPGGGMKPGYYQEVFKTKSAAERAGMRYAGQRIEAQIWLIKKLAHPEAVGKIIPNLSRYGAKVSFRGTDKPDSGENCSADLRFYARPEGLEFYFSGSRTAGHRHVGHQSWTFGFMVENNKWGAVELRDFAEKLMETADALEKNIDAGTLQKPE